MVRVIIGYFAKDTRKTLSPNSPFPKELYIPGTHSLITDDLVDRLIKDHLMPYEVTFPKDVGYWWAFTDSRMPFLADEGSTVIVSAPKLSRIPKDKDHE